MTSNAIVLENGTRIGGGFRSHNELIGKTIRIDGCEVVIVKQCTGGMVMDNNHPLYGHYVYHIVGKTLGRATRFDSINIEVIH